MNTAPRMPHTPRMALRFALAILSVIAVVGLTQCKLTADKLTGIDKGDRGKSAEAPGQCISKCAHQANELMEEERERHKDAVEDCHGDPTCLANEDARHTAAVNEIQEGRRRCMDNCHHQGGGHGH